MPHVISTVYLDIQTAHASGALEAAGAWTATPLALACPSFDFVNLTFTYTRGAAGGSFDWYIETSPYSLAAAVPAGGNQWNWEAIYASGAVGAGALTTSLVQNEIQSFQPLTANAESFPYGPIDLGGAVERIRLLARESGVVGTPGNLHVLASFGVRE